MIKKKTVLISLLLLTMACGLLDSTVWEAEPLPTTAPPLTAPPEERADSPPANVSPLPESPVERADTPAPAPAETPAGVVTPIPAQSSEATRHAEFIRRHENLLVVGEDDSDVNCPADCVLSPIIASVNVGETVSLPYFGDLWANTWAGNDQVYFSWGDGSGMADCMPSLDGMNPSGFESCAIGEDPSGCFRPSEPYSQCDYLDLLCRSFDCNACFPLCPDTPAGLLALRGEAPHFEPCEAGECIVARHIPNSAAAVAAWQHLKRDDKPSSLLFVDGLLVLAGHWPAGAPAHGYIAWSDGVNLFTEVEGSPWTGSSPFKILMFIQMGQAFRLSEDGWVYALGIPEEFDPEEDQPVYLARVPRAGVTDYSQYEYFTGTGGGGEPEWSPNQAAAAPVPGLVSNLQGSAMYHEGIGRYLFIGGRGERPGRDDLLYPERGALFEAPAPWGPWMMVATLPNNWPSTLLTKDAGPTHVYMTRAGEPLGYNLNIIRLDFSLATSP